MTDLDALQEFEDNAYHQSLKPEVSVGAMACAMSALRERIERQQGGWISVEERLPEANGRYLVMKDVRGTPYMDMLSFCVDGEKIDKYDLCGQKNIFYDYDSEYGFIPRDDVTHWMPLPTPPKEDE